MAAPLRIAVTGATGFLGANIVKHALAAGHHVRALKRETSRLDACVGLDPEWVVGDVSNPESLRRAFTGMDVVIHTAALVVFWPGSRNEANRTNVEGARNVVGACLSARVGKLIHTSSLSAISVCYGPDCRIREDSPYPQSREKLVYHNSKRLAELEINKGIGQGLSACHINPSLIFGERDVNFNAAEILRLAKKGAWFYTGGGHSVCDADEVAKAHLAAIEKGRDGERYITGGENITMRQLTELAGEITGSKVRPLFKLPSFVLTLAGFAGDMLGYLLGRELIVSSGVTTDAALYHWNDSTKAMKELGYSIPGARVSMEKCWRWLQANGKV